MNTAGIGRAIRGVTGFAAFAAAGLLFMARPSGSALAAEAPVRGKPIRPLATASASAPAAATNTVPAPAATNANTNEVAALGFETLSTFKYDVPEDGKADALKTDPDEQIPAKVKEFSGRRVSLKGFMLPLKVEGGLVTELLLMRDQSMCCFGAVPKINEWVAVKMTSSGVKPVMDQPVTLLGKLKVGAMRENGYLVGIYQMDGERLDVPAAN